MKWVNWLKNQFPSIKFNKFLTKALLRFQSKYSFLDDKMLFFYVIVKYQSYIFLVAKIF